MSGIKLSPLVTSTTPFLNVASGAHRLFEVRAGVPLRTALEQASCFLACAQTVGNCAATQADSDEMISATYLLEMAKAIVDSAIGALAEEKNRA